MNEQTGPAASRSRTIVRTSVIGILTNVLLAGFKAVMGILSNSIAITLDAVNNISDAASSVITIVGTKLAARRPDKKHPFGYGRIEYLTAMVIAVIVLYAGISSLAESVKKIITPETPDYSAVILIIVAAGVVTKLILGTYVKKTGQRVNSDSLVNSGQDAKLDAVISASTLAAAVIYLVFRIRLEAWLGAVISAVIIKSGIDMLRETLSQILGERADASLAGEIKKTITEFPEVTGAYDLILHNYGPDTFHGSVHIGVDAGRTADELDELIRAVTQKVYTEHGIILTAVGIYSVNTEDPETAAVYETVRQTALADPYIREIHGFYLNSRERSVRLDLVVSFDSPDRSDFADTVEKIKQALPDYTVTAVLDSDFSEED